MRHDSELPPVTLSVYAGVVANVAHVVAQPDAFGYTAGHSATTSVQNPSHGLPHTPPPDGPACTQCVTGSLCAAIAWYARHASELPISAPAVRTAHARPP